VKLRTEAEQPSRTSIFKLDQNWSPNKCWESTSKQVEHHLSFEQGDCLTGREKDASSLRVRRRLFKEAVEDEHLHLTEARDMSTRCPFRDTNSMKVTDEDNLNTMMVETTDETLMSSLLPRLPSCTKKFSDNNTPLSSSVRLLESRDVRFMPTTCAQSLQEREGTGLRTVIIMRIKEVIGKEGRQECENFPDVCCGKEGRQRNENFPCVRHRTEADGGEGHQEQETQSVNPSIESSEACIIGDEEHLKCVNSPAEYNNQSFCSTLFPVSPSDSRHLVVKTEFPGVDKASAKADQIQHLYLGPKVVSNCGTQHQVIRFDNAERQKHQVFSSKNINCANRSLSQGSSEVESSNYKRNMFDYIRENKVFRTVLRYITTN